MNFNPRPILVVKPSGINQGDNQGDDIPMTSPVLLGNHHLEILGGYRPMTFDWIREVKEVHLYSRRSTYILLRLDLEGNPFHTN